MCLYNFENELLNRLVTKSIKFMEIFIELCEVYAKKIEKIAVLNIKLNSGDFKQFQLLRRSYKKYKL